MEMEAATKTKKLVGTYKGKIIDGGSPGDATIFNYPMFTESVNF